MFISNIKQKKLKVKREKNDEKYINKCFYSWWSVVLMSFHYLTPNHQLQPTGLCIMFKCISNKSFLNVDVVRNN